MKTILIMFLLLQHGFVVQAPPPRVAPQKLNFSMYADGFCTISPEGVITLENGKTQAECLRFISQRDAKRA
jgi:hypothetical protein